MAFPRFIRYDGATVRNNMADVKPSGAINRSDNAIFSAMALCEAMCALQLEAWDEECQ